MHSARGLFCTPAKCRGASSCFNDTAKGGREKRERERNRARSNRCKSHKEHTERFVRRSCSRAKKALSRAQLVLVILVRFTVCACACIGGVPRNRQDLYRGHILGELPRLASVRLLRGEKNDDLFGECPRSLSEPPFHHIKERYSRARAHNTTRARTHTQTYKKR